MSLRNPVVRVVQPGRVYAACLRAADWVVAHRVWSSGIAATAVVLTAVLINQFVLLDFPNSGDEYVYLYQGETLAAGRLWNVALPHPDSFAFSYLVHDEGRVWGSFPIGWPLLMALALSMGVPAWLVNPLLAAASLVLVYGVGARLHSPRVGVLAAGLVAISPFVLFNAASYFSHTFCGALLLGAAWLAARPDRTPAWVPMGVGFLIGWAVLARYFTGALCAVPIVLLLLRPGVPMVRTVLWVALGGLPWMAVLFAYNDAMTGNPWQLTTLPGTVSLWFAPGMWGRGGDILATRVLRLLLWAPPMLLVLYAIHLRRTPRTRGTALVWLPLATAVIMYAYVERGGNQYGPRFWYEVFPFLVIAATAQLFKDDSYAHKTRGERWQFGLMLASVALMPVALAVHAVQERRVVVERTDLYSQVAAARLRDAIVLVDGRVGSLRTMGSLDLTRNGIGAAPSVLYALHLGAHQACDLMAHFPERAVYLYTWNVAARRGTLAPTACQVPAATRRAHVDR